MTSPPLPSRLVRAGVRRRQVLLAGALAMTVLPVATACTQPPVPEGPDPLAELAARAKADGELAAAIAAAHPGLAAQATVVAGDRKQHAAAIDRELDRARPDRASTSPGPSATSTAAPPPVVPPQPAAALAGLREALTAAEKQAADLVPGLPGHRAGLIGSVAASCASLREVLA